MLAELRATAGSDEQVSSVSPERRQTHEESAFL